jgi:ssDNA-binding Zn-finger/Zn-ribbon topoisomerase 1
MSNIIKTEPKPYCPECGGQMTLRRPKSYQDWEAFWGCSNYPECRGSRNIMSNGEPEMSNQEYMELNSKPLFEDYYDA